MALVAAQQFPNPLQQGADAIVGSTHKSLNGPQKAIAMFSAQHVHQKVWETCEVFISNNHPASTAALSVCLAEFGAFGNAYAVQLVRNANKLAKALHASGITLHNCNSVFGDNVFTMTQHVWINCKHLGWPAETAVQDLYRAGIVANTLYLPRVPGSGLDKDKEGKGIRLGTTEVTRLGMGEQEMEKIADYICDVLLKRRSLQRIRPDVERLRGKYLRPRFCF
jgi:glycine hydroxymethyltransferase